MRVWPHRLPDCGVHLINVLWARPGSGRPGFRPVHPGRIIKRNIDGLGLTIEAFADHIGTSRQTVHAIIAGRSAVREEMAVRLARAFKTTPQFWLNLQSNHVVWELERLHRFDRIRPLKKRGGQQITRKAVIFRRKVG
jgi:antitoxin HigA-1